MAFLSAFFFRNRKGKVKIPYFIGLFVLAMAASTYIPFVQSCSRVVVNIAKSGLTLTLFLIGCGLSNKVLQAVGFKPLVQGIVSWVLISGVALWAVMVLAR